MAEWVLVSTGTLHAAELRPNLADLQSAWNTRGGATGVLAALQESATEIGDSAIGEAYIEAVLQTKAAELRAAHGDPVRIARHEEIVANTVGWSANPWDVLLLTSEEYTRWEKGEMESGPVDSADLDYGSNARLAGEAAVDRLFTGEQA